MNSLIGLDQTIEKPSRKLSWVVKTNQAQRLIIMLTTISPNCRQVNRTNMPIEMNGVNTNVDDGLAPSTASQVMLHSRTSYFIPMEGVSASL